MITVYQKIENCSYCGKKATIFFMRKGLLSTSWRFFCEECAKQHSRILDDAGANYK